MILIQHLPKTILRNDINRPFIAFRTKERLHQDQWLLSRRVGVNRHKRGGSLATTALGVTYTFYGALDQSDMFSFSSKT